MPGIGQAVGSAESGVVLLASGPTGLLQAVTIDADGKLNIAPLAASTEAIGKLAANSGVDIGDVDVKSIAAGTNIIGYTKDAGPSWELTRTPTSSSDMTSAADITAAPVSGQKIVAVDILVSTDTAMLFSVVMETSGNVLAAVYLPANGTAQITLRGFLKGDAADKKLQGLASAAGNVKITAVYFSEP